MKIYRVLILFFLIPASCSSPQDDSIGSVEEFITSGEYDSAEELCREMISVSPEDPEANFFLGEILLYKAGLSKFRIQVLNFMTRYRRWPEYAKIRLHHIDYSALNTGQLKEGITYLNHVLEVSPDFSFSGRDVYHIYRNLGWAYLAVKDNVMARAEFEKLRPLDDPEARDVLDVFLNLLEADPFPVKKK